MKPYPEYKDSGIAWLGQIPSHWGLVPNKRLLKIKKSVVGSDNADYTLLSLTLNGVIPRDMDNPQGKFPADFDTYQVVDNGDLIFCLFDMDETPRTVGLAKQSGMITGAYTVTQPTNIVGGYIYSLYFSLDNAKGLRPFYTGLRKTIQKETFLSIKTPVPPPDEQSAIVAFLDRKTAEIDEFIGKKRQLIALLNEQKTAIISQAVTKGLDPTVPMKPSGVDWLGEIPAHWEVRRAKFIFREIAERSGTGDGIHLSMSQKYGLIPQSEAVDRLAATESQEGFKQCEVGDLVLNKLKSHLGVFAVASLAGLVSPDYAVYRAKGGANVHYFERLFKTKVYISEFTKAASGIVIGFLRLYTPDFFNIPCLYPPVAEQAEIVEHIEHEGATIDGVISRIEREIELIQEYRTTLISEAVTGKIDVREAAD